MHTDFQISVKVECFMNFTSLGARFIRRISVVSNAIQTVDNEAAYLIIQTSIRGQCR